MKNFKAFFPLLCALVVFVSCSKDEDNTGGNTPDFNAITIVTKPAVLAGDNLSFASGGNVSMNVSSTNEYQVGVCYSNSSNPTVASNIDYSYQVSAEDFNNSIHDLVFGQTYYIKAFVRKFSTG